MILPHAKAVTRAETGQKPIRRRTGWNSARHLLHKGMNFMRTCENFVDIVSRLVRRGAASSSRPILRASVASRVTDMAQAASTSTCPASRRGSSRSRVRRRFWIWRWRVEACRSNVSAKSQNFFESAAGGTTDILECVGLVAAQSGNGGIAVDEDSALAGRKNRKTQRSVARGDEVGRIDHEEVVVTPEDAADVSLATNDDARPSTKLVSCWPTMPLEP